MHIGIPTKRPRILPLPVSRGSLLLDSSKEGLSRGASAPGSRSEWASMAPRAGSAPHPPWSCTMSVREGLVGERHTCKGPSASCVPARPCRVFPLSGSKTTDNEMSLRTQTGIPVRVRNISKSGGPSGDGVSTLRGAQFVTARWLPGWASLECEWREETSDASDSRGGGGGRVACNMWWERRPPCRLMYATVAVLSVRTSTCSPHKRLLRRFKARCTASNSSQLMCQCSWGPVQTPNTASPLNVAPQPLAKASV